MPLDPAVQTLLDTLTAAGQPPMEQLTPVEARAAVDDAYAVLEWVAKEAGALGVDPARIAVGGDSAGGNLAAVVAQLARDRRGPAIVTQALIYPVTTTPSTRPATPRMPTGTC